MLLSVIVYKHTLTGGQWLGAAIVFAGIGVEAWVKRKGGYCGVALLIMSQYLFPVVTEVHAKKVLRELEKAKLKSL
jgi:UDP-galactose transporter B1